MNLRVVEKEDFQLLADWNNSPEFFGEFIWFPQRSKTEVEKMYDTLTSDTKWFIIEKEDGTRIGTVQHFLTGNLMEIGYALVPSERRKGYCSESVKIIVDYLFLSRELVRVQAVTDVNNFASQRVLEKAGFTKEGIVRKSAFIRGKWRDGYLFSILREEWKEPKILTRTANVC